jgi:DNA-binding transcriptional LysR family regulator
LGRTQPSLSARLAALEAEWKTKLFRRHARGMSLTPEGAALLGPAEAALASLQAVDRAAGVGAAVEGELRVGSGDALGREVLPRALAILKRERPGLAVRVIEGPAPRLLDALRRGEVDVALITGADGEDRGVLRQPLLTSRIDLLTPARAAPGRRAATPAGLAGQAIVSLQRGSGFRRHLEAAFAAEGVPFRPAIEVGNLSLVRRFVAAGLGVAPVPSIAFPRGGRSSGTTQRPMRGVDPIAYTVATRAGVPPSSSTRRLIDLVRMN